MSGPSVQDIAPIALPLLSAAFMMAFAAVLLALDFSRLANRIFALFLIFRSITSALGLLRSVMPVEVIQAVTGYFLLPVVPLLLYLPLVYPRRRGIGASRWGAWLLLGVIVALEGAYMLDHSLLWSFGPVASSTGYNTIGSGLAYTGYGPLQLVTGLLYPSYGIVALLLVREYLAAKEPTHSLLLVVAGFLLNGLFDGTSRIMELWQLAAASTGYEWLPWGWARSVLPALTVIPCILAVAMLLRRADAARRPMARRLAWLSFLPPASAVAANLLTGTTTGVASLPGYVLLGLWRLTIPCLVTYALLRYRLFDIDAKVRVAITDGTLVVAFLVAFWGVDQALQFLLSQVAWFGPMLLSIFMAFYGGRLHRFAQRAAARLMPQAKRMREMTEAERLQAYQERYALALEDGSLSAKEQAMLRSLGTRLGLRPEALSLGRPLIAAG